LSFIENWKSRFPPEMFRRDCSPLSKAFALALPPRAG
jgi:hypothetical protein